MKLIPTLVKLLMYEIEHGTQRSVALLYATCLEGFGEEPGFATCRKANRAIIARWSFGGLDRVKKIAWTIAVDNAREKEGRGDV